jgi:hypothetical protein
MRNKYCGNGFGNWTCHENGKGIEPWFFEYSKEYFTEGYGTLHYSFNIKFLHMFWLNHLTYVIDNNDGYSYGTGMDNKFLRQDER